MHVYMNILHLVPSFTTHYIIMVRKWSIVICYSLSEGGSPVQAGRAAAPALREHPLLLAGEGQQGARTAGGQVPAPAAKTDC